MKKHILLPFVLGLGLFLFANPVKAQNFQIVASFGTAHNWAVPNAVLYEIDYYYPYHQIVHINREQRGRSLFYNVLLERRGQFVELFFGRQAIILDVNYYHSYPLAQHICSGHCGYHGNFYRTHQVACNHRGHGNGYGNSHNHIAYRSGRNYNTYAARSSAANRNVRSTHVAHNRSTNASRQSSSRSQVRNESVRNANNRSSTSRYSADRGDSRRGSAEVRIDKRKGSSSAERVSSSSGRGSRNAVSSSSRSRNK